MVGRKKKKLRDLDGTMATIEFIVHKKLQAVLQVTLEYFEAMLDSQAHTYTLAIEDVLYLEVGVHYCGIFFINFHFWGVGRARAT